MNNTMYKTTVVETLKTGAEIATLTAVLTVGTYGGSKVGHAIINGVEDVASAATKEIGKTVKKAVKKTFRKKKFFEMF